MSIIDFTNFERQGNIKNDIQLDSLEDIRESAITLSSSALRTVRIFTPDLEPLIYNHDEIRNNLLAFSRGNRHAKIQLLVDDIQTALHQGHRLIQLAQQLTSAMTIKLTPEDYQHNKISFMLVDQSKFIFRSKQNSQRAIYSECKHRSGKLLELFTPAWEQAQQDIQSRRISI